MSAAALVTGATGFVGRALVSHLVRTGVTPIAVERPGRLVRDSDGGVVRRVVSTYAAEDLRRALAGHDFRAVYHLAAAGVDPAHRSIDELFAGNVDVTRNLFTALQGRQLDAFVHVGSCSEYAAVSAGTLIDESTPLLPTSAYGGAKAAAGLVARTLAADRGVPFTGVRLFGVFGPGEGAYRLIPYLLTRLRRGEPVDLTTGEQVRDFTYVGDVAEGLARMAAFAGREAFVNLCSGRGVAVRELAGLVASAIGADPALLKFGARPSRADEPPWLVGSPARMRAVLGWGPPTSVDAGVRLTCEYAEGAT